MKQRPRSLMFALAAICISGVLLPGKATAKYPEKTIYFIVPFAAGGGTDVLARAVADRLQHVLGVPVVVENKPGAGGTIGTEFVAKAAPDGYTIVMGTNATLALAPGLYQHLRYDPAKDFAPIASVASGPSILIVRTALPVTDMNSFLTYLKSNSGKLNYGSAGNGSMAHIATALLLQATGTHALHVPFRGGSAAIMKLAAGRLQFMIAGPVEATAMMNGGKVRGIAVTTAQRFEGFPDLPTIASDGLPGYAISNWFGVFAPAGTPDDARDVLARNVVRITADPAVKELFLKQGVLPQHLEGAAYADFVRGEIEKWKAKVHELNISVD